ncbi:hypothetical protein VTK73DRAFT_6444 [Phialemonium thermophilum]|uniref:Uncharacterized protein n=1 Tax=Phialemonium thermophilum TaxID=223376 RepID=A0ABR3UZG0_9PEZI
MSLPSVELVLGFRSGSLSTNLGIPSALVSAQTAPRKLLCSVNSLCAAIRENQQCEPRSVRYSTMGAVQV